jgi:hypothetical protein
MVKDRQVELQRIIDTLRQVIGTRSTSWHPLIHLGEVPVAQIQSQIVDTVLELDAGKRMGTPDVWEVYAVPLDEEQALVNTELSFSVDPGDVRRIRIASKLPFLSYLNQIREKAEFPQGDPNHPFLVVLDQGSGAAMPMRHQRIESELAPWLPLWRRVSGILCFDQRPYIFGKFCWKLSFRPNPGADLPLPDALLQLTPHDAEICVNPFA